MVIATSFAHKSNRKSINLQHLPAAMIVKVDFIEQLCYQLMPCNRRRERRSNYLSFSFSSLTLEKVLSTQFKVEIVGEQFKLARKSLVFKIW